MNISGYEPFDVRLATLAACVAADNCDRRGLAAQLGDLYALRPSGALDAGEYARAKAALSPGIPAAERGALPPT